MSVIGEEVLITNAYDDFYGKFYFITGTVWSISFSPKNQNERQFKYGSGRNAIYSVCENSLQLPTLLSSDYKQKMTLYRPKFAVLQISLHNFQSWSGWKQVKPSAGKGLAKVIKLIKLTNRVSVASEILPHDKHNQASLEKCVI